MFDFFLAVWYIKTAAKQAVQQHQLDVLLVKSDEVTVRQTLKNMLAYIVEVRSRIAIIRKPANSCAL
jgi:hypothetical protein